MAKFEEFFKESEFSCPCCGASKLDPEFKQKIAEARAHANYPFVIVSGRRCHKHNEKVEGAPQSSHMRGKAADIAVPNNRGRYRILYGLIKAGFKRIGFGKTFFHADSDEEKIQGTIWTYDE